MREVQINANPESPKLLKSKHCLKEHASCLGSLKAPLQESMLTCLAWLYNSMLLRKFLLKLPLAANGFEYGVFSSFEGGMGKHISRYSQ